MEQLVRKAKSGDGEAFITLIEQNKEMLKRVAFAYLKNQEDIADAVQDTILDAFEHIKDLKKPQYFRTWLVRILINNCARIYRRNLKHTNYELLPEEYGSRAGNQDKGQDLSTDLEFMDLLKALPEESRTIFQLYYGEQFTIADVAKLLRINENTVKSRLRRGKELLRSQL